MANLAVSEITQGLRARVLGRRIVYHDQIGSTNDAARQLAEAGEAEGTLVIADAQNAGRGRLGRTWVAPPQSSLLMSLILRPPLTPAQLPRVTMALALGACDALRQAGVYAQIKWPNDLLVRGKKCAGILAEASTLGDQIEFAIIGLGINVNFAAATVAGIPAEATTLADEVGHAIPREPLARAILQCGDAYYARLCAGENLRAEWIARLATLRQRVRAHAETGIIEGIAESVDDDGALMLRCADGSLVRLLAGDVTLTPRQTERAQPAPDSSGTEEHTHYE